ncbi:uncharacterized protein LOC121197609 isoform X2 [Toxotes jaculatrix]|uniref:uncharacterized protein LOC121197609 isoform X2 n=1 Tax=Toxotes jaculatrix TaxID=941984 RepID=UPI001B3ADFED|nr:uncharacterized protein LOC121197609 isoform X2 [Toxotes jaculatrix]
MDSLSTYFVEETNCMRGRKEEEEEEEEVEEEEEEEEEEEQEDNSQTEESAIQKQQRSAWAPCFFYKTDREVYYYAGQEISIEGALDSYAGTIWPAALTLCHYLDTHRERLNLVDKAVLEIGAGTGLVSVVAALLGAWVTATDLPEVLNNLRVNLSRNTRGRCRHTPQVAALSWDYNLEHSYPTSIYRYDYVLAADVVYHHNFLDELLATMKHFCRPGTTVIWANKIRMENDVTFTEKFKKAFHTSLLAEDGDIKIFMATCREGEFREGDEGLEIQDLQREDEEGEEEEAEDEKNKEKLVEDKPKEDKFHCVKEDETEEPCTLEAERGDDAEEKNEHECDEEEEMEEIKDNKEDEETKPENSDQSCSTTASHEDATDSEEKLTFTEQAPQKKQDRAPAWVPSIICCCSKDVYHYVGQDIVIYESIDSFGAVMWPAALALCSFLDNNRERVNLQGKEVLELGAGTGLVAIVASLLGASVTATDLPEVLSNLRANVMRNTRGRCRHLPQVAALSWSYDLECTYPTSIYRYDYVLAADVVYHHDFLDELLATMKHFCEPGTTVIWANKIRMENDLTFIEKFKKAFHTSLLAEDGDIKIFMATCRE